MTDKEIIKALECCNPSNRSCVECPRFNEFKCYTKVMVDALDLINRQQAEIERLQKHIQNGIDLAKQLPEMIATAEAEAIKKFAEMLKENTIDVDVSYGYGREHYTEAVAVIEIDNCLKKWWVRISEENSKTRLYNSCNDVFVSNCSNIGEVRSDDK